MTTLTTGRATDFITFSRPGATGGGATVTDRDGKIKWAGHNLLTNSESFDASAWRKESVTVTANFAAAPNGTTTADRAVYAGGLGTPNLRLIDQQVTMNTSSVAFTLAIWVSGTGKFRLKNTHVGVVDNFSSDITATATPTLYTLAVTNSATNGGSQQVGIVAATTDDAFDLRIWGAHLYRSDLGSMVLNPARGDAYYPTTPRNLLGFTEDFSNAAWSKSSTSVSTNLAIAPNGLQTADLLYPASTGTGRQTFHTAACVSGTRYMNSFYVKSAGFRWIALISPRGITYGVYFDIINGVKGTEASGCTGTITPVGDGWFRCTVTDVTASTTAYSGFVLVDADNSTTATANGTSGAYFWGAQLSDSASLDAYSPVYGAAVTSAAYYAPRLDYSGSSLAALGLLVEEQRTNFIVNSNSPIASTGTTITASAAISPDGTQNAYRIAKTDATTPRYISRNTGSMTTVGGRTYTVSAWFKYDGHNVTVSLEYNSTANWDLSWIALFSVTSTGVTTLSASSCTQSVQDVGNGWYRAIVTFTNGPSPSVTSNPTVLTRIDGGSGTSVLGYGGQIEELAAFPTSYIPTGASSATRTADVASVSTQAFPYSATAGSYVANFQTLFGGTQTLTTTILTVDGSGSKLIAYITGGAQNAGTFDGSTIVSVANDVTGSISKIGSSFDASGRSFCANGSTVATGTVAAGYGSGSAVNIGGTLGTGYINGWFRQLTYIPRRLSSSELQARTV